ncbi:MAG: flavin oxidoreductase/NADH oxidase [Clostridia bacterium]|nr:flavin oxidoreductase/NADH oxidase [Clostridia bacterium]
MFAFEKKNGNTYNFATYDELSYILRNNGIDIPMTRDTSALHRTPTVRTAGRDFVLSNSISVHPMEGFDGREDGSPSDLTERRYLRFASSGAALIWSEAIAVCPEGRTSDHQLMITDENVGLYAALVKKIKSVTSAPIIAQLTHSGRFSKNSSYTTPIFMTRNPVFESVRPNDKNIPTISDDYLDTLAEKYESAAKLAIAAGFDGVDLKICHHYLLGESLSAYERQGKYGGSYENRTRLINDIYTAVRAVLPYDKILASRFGLSDMIPYPHGFGMSTDGAYEPDFTETVRLLNELHEKYGLALVDITMGSPYYNPHINRPYNKGGYTADEHPLKGVERLLCSAEKVKKQVGGITFVGTGYSYLREFSPYVAAAALERGCADLAGFGRMAFAYEKFASDMLADSFDAKKTCITCSKCTELMRHGSCTGCPVRDQEVYLPIYRKVVMGKQV